MAIGPTVSRYDHTLTWRPFQSPFHVSAPAQDRSTGVGQYVASGGDRRRANQAEGAEFLPANVAHLPLAKVSPPRDCHDAVLLSWQRAAGNAQLKHIAFYIDAELDKACN